MRGDRPVDRLWREYKDQFTPHARGSTVRGVDGKRQGGVYPACAGIDRRNPRSGACGHGLPRMRGDRPYMPRLYTIAIVFTPHARGSTRSIHNPEPTRLVYPACAGIDRVSVAKRAAISCLPRMRGDRPPNMGNICRG